MLVKPDKRLQSYAAEETLLTAKKEKKNITVRKEEKKVKTKITHNFFLWLLVF